MALIAYSDDKLIIITFQLDDRVMMAVCACLYNWPYSIHYSQGAYRTLTVVFPDFPGQLMSIFHVFPRLFNQVDIEQVRFSYNTEYVTQFIIILKNRSNHKPSPKFSGSWAMNLADVASPGRKKWPWSLAIQTPVSPTMIPYTGWPVATVWEGKKLRNLQGLSTNFSRPTPATFYLVTDFLQSILWRRF